MSSLSANRRTFLKQTTGLAALSALAPSLQAAPRVLAPRIKFAVIGINHGHINSQVDSTIRGGGELVSFFAKEPDLVANFAKRYPQAKLA
ncbi:MAG TPA: gfo/Idh/MocA family oxidoreductase, partial [Fibrella sp.]